MYMSMPNPTLYSSIRFNMHTQRLSYQHSIMEFSIPAKNVKKNSDVRAAPKSRRITAQPL